MLHWEGPGNLLPLPSSPQLFLFPGIIDDQLLDRPHTYTKKNIYIYIAEFHIHTI